MGWIMFSAYREVDEIGIVISRNCAGRSLGQKSLCEFTSTLWRDVKEKKNRTAVLQPGDAVKRVGVSNKNKLETD